MKRVEQLYAGILLVIMGLVVVHAPLSVALGTALPDYAQAIKGWKELLMVLASVLAVVLLVRGGRVQEFLRDKVVIVALGFVALHIASLLYWPGWEQALAGLAIDLRYVVYFLLVYLLIRLAPEYRRKFLRVAAAGAAVVVGFACVQLVLPADSLKYLGYSADTIAPYQMVDQNPDFVRSQSTLRGPNPFAAYMVIVLAAVVAYSIGGGRYRMAALLAAAVSAGLLYLGYSRAALLGGVVAVGLLMAMKYRGRLTPKRLALAGAGIAVLGVAFVAVLQTDFGSTVFLHTDPNEAGRINSDDKRIESLAAGAERALAQPFGVGIGSTGSASLHGGTPLIIENHYLFIAHEVGWLGLVLFGLLFYGVMVRLWRQRHDVWASAVFASGIGLALVGLFLPVWADDTVSIVWWGLAGILIAGGAQTYGRQSTKQKTARTA